MTTAQQRLNSMRQKHKQHMQQKHGLQKQAFKARKKLRKAKLPPRAPKPAFIKTQQPRKVTNDRTKGLEYTNSIKALTYALISLEVPSTRISAVIKSVITILELGTLGPLPCTATCCNWYQEMLFVSVGATVVQWDLQGRPELLASSDGTSYKGQDFYTQTLYCQDSQGQTQSCDFGATLLADETCATTVQALNDALSLSRAATANLLTEAERDQLRVKNLAATRSDHANNALKGKKRALEEAKATDQGLSAEEWSALSKVERNKRSRVAAFGCSDHKADNSMKATSAACNAFWGQQSASAAPVLLPSEEDRSKGQTGTGGGSKLTHLTLRVFSPSDHGKMGCQIYARPFAAFQEDKHGKVLYSWPEESKARFLEGMAASVLTLAARDDILAFFESQPQGLSNIAVNVCRGLNDTPTLLELAANALLYFQVGFPAISIKKAGPDQLQMEEVYQSAVRNLNALTEDAHPLLSCDQQVFSFRDQAAPQSRRHAHRHAVVSFVQGLSPEDSQMLVDLLSVMAGSVSTTLQRFAADQLQGGANTVDALTETFGTDWVAALPKVSPSNNRDEGALGSTKITARKAHNLDTLKLQGKLAYARNNTTAALAGLSRQQRFTLFANAKAAAHNAGTFSKRKGLVRKQQHARQLVKNAQVRRLQDRRQALQDKVDGLTLLPLDSTTAQVSRGDLCCSNMNL